MKEQGSDARKQGDLAYCQHCMKLTPRTDVERFVAKGHDRGHFEYERSRCAVCGHRQLARTPGADCERGVMKLTISSITKRDVLRERFGQIGKATGKTASAVIEEALERYLYGPQGNWTDDPLVDAMAERHGSKGE